LGSSTGNFLKGSTTACPLHVSSVFIRLKQSSEILAGEAVACVVRAPYYIPHVT
jgi:hypothetical protein